MSKKIVVKKAGNMEGLAKHLAKKLGGDPHFFEKCAADEELSGYDTEVRNAICARAHKLVTGIWPGEHTAAERKKKELTFTFNPDLMKDIKETTSITIDNDEDADWMHSLPGYKDEVAIHEKLAAAHAKEHYNGELKVVVKEEKKIIAKRGDDVYLVGLGGDKAVIVNIQTKQVSKPMNKDAFLKFGYWSAYTGEQNTDVLNLI